MRIMFAGPSGVGKTTLAKFLTEELKNIYDQYEFLSGSISDLIPKTKDIPHKDMLQRDSDELYKEDYKLLNLRNRLYKDQTDFVTDRSYLDLAAYFLYKQAPKVADCEIDQFLRICSKLLVEQADVLILFELTQENIHTWVTEDNCKRITNNYFQATISNIMVQTLNYMDYRPDHYVDYLKKGLFKRIDLSPSVEIGYIDNIYGRLKVIKIKQMNQNFREQILKHLVVYA